MTTGSSGTPPTAGHSSTDAMIAVGWEARDRHWWLTALALAAVVIAAAMALFGLPPVDLHSPLHKVGIMDPFCGGTRAARFTAQGRLAEAWRYNPLSIVIVLVGAIALARAAIGLTTHRWLSVAVAWTPRRRRIVVTFALLLIVALEIRQQLRADLLMAGTHTWR